MAAAAATAPAETPPPTDTTPPTVKFYSGPTGPTTEARPAFSWDESEPGLTYTCSFDAEPFRPCGEPYYERPAQPLALGPHSFTVKAADAAGNEGTDSRSFLVVSNARVIRVGKARFDRAKGTATFALFVDQPGIVRVYGIGVQSTEVSTEGAERTISGFYKVIAPIRPTAGVRGYLRRDGVARVKATLRYETPYVLGGIRVRELALKLARD
jgi:hypothetical protein